MNDEVPHMHTKKVLALDFDGLLVDGLKECILVSWNGNFEKGLHSFSDAGFLEIPSSFIKKFKNHRGFAKHLGHFLMPFQATAGIFKTQAEFDEAYAKVDPEMVESFISRATTYRNAVREKLPKRWLAYHQFYPGVAQMLRSSELPICIVTAKDRQSVKDLLNTENISIPDSQIYGECREKISALNSIATHLAVKPGDILFFDDNVLNAREAQQAGFRSHWAVWGYHSPEHFHLAKEEGLPIVELAQFVHSRIV